GGCGGGVGGGGVGEGGKEQGVGRCGVEAGERQLSGCILQAHVAGSGTPLGARRQRTYHEHASMERPLGVMISPKRHFVVRAKKKPERPRQSGPGNGSMTYRCDIQGLEAHMPTQPAAPPASNIAMATTHPEYALPMVDVTHPRFAVPDDPQAARALHEAFIAGERRRARIPKFIMRIMLRSAARKSRLVHALVQSKAEYLDGLTTYVMKLGADNLVPPFDTPMDRRCADSPHVGLFRLRMQQADRFRADGFT